MTRRVALAITFLILASSARGAGWHDFQLEIAPGFSVIRSNSFEVCLGTPEGGLLVCPFDYRDQEVGPLVEYAITPELILTRHLGARPHPKNPEILQGDPERELFFLVRRSDQQVAGPFARTDWEREHSPRFSDLEWQRPRNPNFWAPLLGNLFVLGFAAVYSGWPILLLAVSGLIFWLYHRRTRRLAA